MNNLQVSSESRDGVWIIHLEGFLDANNHGLFREAVVNHVGKGHYKLVVDFSKLRYIGSSGIEVVLSYIQTLRDNGGDMVLSTMAPKIFKVFDLLGLPALFAIRDTVEEAVDALRS